MQMDMSRQLSLWMPVNYQIWQRSQERFNQSLSQLALSWVLRAESVTSVLIGASSPEQIVQNLGILRSPAFTAEELAKIDAITGMAY